MIELLDTHITEIDRTMADLRRLRHALTTARHSADQTRRTGADAVICHVIQTNTTDPAAA